MKNVLTSLVARQAGKYGDRAAVYYRRPDGKWLPYSWNEMLTMVSNTACSYAALGIREESRVAVFSANDPFTLVSEFAAFANRIVPVSIYATSSENQVEFIVRDAQAEVIFVGDQTQYAIARRVAARVDCLKQIVTYKPIVLHREDTTTLNFAQFMRIGENARSQWAAEVERRTMAATPGDIATLLYTSGTTGDPKGAILTHGCFDAALEAHHRRLTSVSDKDTSMCFLPLSHVFEKGWTYFALDCGVRIYVNSNPREIQTTLAEVHPTCMCSVPRFWEKAYATILDKMGRMKPFKRWLCRRALEIGRRRNLDYVRRGCPVPTLLEWQYKFYYKNVFRQVQRIMGVENGNIFPTAGAPLSNNITEFFRGMGVPIVVGYGLSETTATVSCYPYVNYEIGSVGVPLDMLSVRIGENDEIQVKGPTVMRGYYNRPQENEAAFTADGYFRTGDAGYIDKNGALFLTDRIKDLFKTSNGKYIAPQAIESRLGEDKYIEQVAVIGDNRKYVSALIVPSLPALKEYAGENGIPYASDEDLVANPRINEMMAERIEGMLSGLASFEKIKKFTLLPAEFTMEAGELTNTLKIRRPVINKRYADVIEAMYQ